MSTPSAPSQSSPLEASASAHAPSAQRDVSRWFAEQVQPHEGQLRSYLRGSFPNVRDVDDIVQESYLRIFRERAVRPLRSVRGFLFEIARRLALDNVRRDKTAMHSAVKDFDSDGVFVEETGIAETISKREEVRLLAEAIHALPARCREIMILRKMEGLTHKQISERLGIAEGTINVQIARGMDRCSQYLRERGLVLTPPAP